MTVVLMGTQSLEADVNDMHGTFWPVAFVAIAIAAYACLLAECREQARAELRAIPPLAGVASALAKQCTLDAEWERPPLPASLRLF